MMRLKGKRFAGEGNASRTIAIQLPLIAKTFPEVMVCHNGTINLELEAPLIVICPDHRTPPIKWKKDPQFGEIFDFVRVCIEIPTKGETHDAWLYVAHRSAHRQNLSKHELISPCLNIDGIQELNVVIKRSCIHLPYKHNPVYVVV